MATLIILNYFGAGSSGIKSVYRRAGAAWVVGPRGGAGWCPGCDGCDGRASLGVTLAALEPSWVPGPARGSSLNRPGRLCGQ